MLWWMRRQLFINVPPRCAATTGAGLLFWGHATAELHHIRSSSIIPRREVIAVSIFEQLFWLVFLAGWLLVAVSLIGGVSG